jgi:riboflavin synthase
MFTGIIEEIGVVSRRSGAELEIVAAKVLEDARLGDSIAVDGVCLTVAARNAGSFVVQVSPETYSRSTLGRLKPGHAVNLERAMQAGGRFGGHFVLGHVDGVGLVDHVEEQGGFALWHFKAPAEVARYLVPKGSVTIDGISLTVVSPKGEHFAVAVIPVTLKETTLSKKRAGDPVNMEADVLGKHILHYLTGPAQHGGITQEFLSRHGYA